MRLFILILILAGIALLLPAAPLPTNDGGLWVAFSAALNSTWPILPTTFQFNGGEMIAAYPPLAAYLLVALQRGFGVAPIYAITWLPMFLWLMALPLFGVFCKRFWRGSDTWLWCVLVFALTFNSSRWFIMGGGVPRGLGLIAQLSCWIALLPGATAAPKRVRDLLLAGVAFGLAILSHPTAAIWTLVGVICLEWRASFDFVKQRAVVGVVAALVVAPWAILVLSRFGLTPYLAAFSEGGQALEKFFYFFVAPTDTFAPHQLLGVFGVIGLCGLVASRQFVLPVMLLLGLCFDPRGLVNLHGVPLLALFVGFGLRLVNSLFVAEARLPLARVLFALLVVLGSIHSFLLLRRSPGNYMQTPTAADFAAVKALNERYPAPQRILVLSDFEKAGDAISEWIATFTHHESVTMHQGREWYGDFISRQTTQLEINRCCRESSLECVRGVLAGLSGKVSLIIAHSRSCQLPGDSNADGFFEVAVPALAGPTAQGAE